MMRAFYGGQGLLVSILPAAAAGIMALIETTLLGDGSMPNIMQRKGLTSAPDHRQSKLR